MRMTDKRLRDIIARGAKAKEIDAAFAFYDTLEQILRDYAIVIKQQRDEVQSIQTCLRDSETQREALSAELAKLRWVRDEIEAREKRAIARENKRLRMVRR